MAGLRDVKTNPGKTTADHRYPLVMIRYLMIYEKKNITMYDYVGIYIYIHTDYPLAKCNHRNFVGKPLGK